MLNYKYNCAKFYFRKNLIDKGLLNQTYVKISRGTKL